MNEMDTPTEKIYCYRHPDQETRLRCNRCNQPICPKCAVATPTGYRCPDCVRSQQKVFDTARMKDYPLAILAAGILAYLGSFITQYFGFFTIFLAPLVGVIISGVVRRITGRRRSKRLFQFTAAAAAVGSLPIFVIRFIMTIYIISSQEAAGVYSLISLLWPGIYTVLVTSSVYYRLSGVKFRS